jgi:hypothetical protein
LTESSPKEKISKGLTSHKEKSTSLILYRKDGTALEVFVRLSPLKRGNFDLAGDRATTNYRFTGLPEALKYENNVYLVIEPLMHFLACNINYTF